MPRKHNAHDSGYKMLFSNHELIRQLLTGFVNEEWIKAIEFDSLERIDKSFVTDEFSERESDIIYRVKFSGKDIYIYILLEFQSTVDRFMSLRILRYVAEFYEYLVKNRKHKILPAVFPFMLYNGEKRWTAPEELHKLIENSIPDRYIPHFRYYKIAENEFDREFLKRMNNAVAALFYTENNSGKELQHEIDTIVELIRHEKPGELSAFINWFKYMFQERPELVEKIQGADEVRTMLRTSIKQMQKQYFLEGKQEGIQEGIQKGIQKGKIETARNLLKENMSVQKIAAITGLPVSEIEKLK